MVPEYTLMTILGMLVVIGLEAFVFRSGI
ncbi:MAG: lycopene cyclase domain-containing protein, partial [Brevibacterium sp.]|nr:lycopene cyclase domain-containing protein [Brevibacterium sp.]